MNRRSTMPVLVVVFLAGCQSAPKSQPPAAPKFGPPPPGYHKIVGHAVSQWQPADMLPAARGANPLAWQFLGARPITGEFWSGSDDASGRCVSIAIHPTDSNTVYVASASGGVWKTTDGGLTWTPITDELAILNHGAVALDPADPDTLWVGTGEYTTSSNGDGVFRSLDGGLTFAHLGSRLDTVDQCSGIAVDSTDGNVVHVTGSTGYVRTTDAGQTWTRIISAPCSALALDPVNPQRVFVARSGDGIYRSLDGGQNFTKLTGGLPAAGFSRIVMSQCAGTPDTIYAALISGSALLDLYKTTDGGDTWTVKPNTPDFPNPQGWYDAFVAVSPTNPNLVYCGGVFPSYAVAGVIRSTNGGDNWTDVTVGSISGQLHPDQHVGAFAPNGTFWVGNDGGVWKTTNSGASWINCNAGLAVTQNYNIAIHPSDTAQVMTGTQDNGTIGRFADVDDWPQIIGGDGGYLAYDHADPSRIYTTYVRLTTFRFDNNGFADITGPWSGDSRQFISPLIMDPNDSHTLLGGTTRIWRTTNAHTAADWTPISPHFSGTVVNAIAVAEGDSNIIYASAGTRVWYTANAANWFERSPGLANGTITDICISPTDPDVAYISSARLNGDRVLRTDDAGQTWVGAAGDLPGMTRGQALAVDWRFDPPALVLGTGAGVYYSANGGANWTKDGLDLPNVNIGDLAIDPVNNTVTAATYGRGAWRAALPNPAGPAGDIDGDGDVDLNDFATFSVCLSGAGGMTPPPGCSAAEFAACDLDGDGDVDLGDFATFSTNFGL